MQAAREYVVLSKMTLWPYPHLRIPLRVHVGPGILGAGMKPTVSSDILYRHLKSVAELDKVFITETTP